MVFASIYKIIVLSSNTIYFIVKTILTFKFAAHFHAFEIQRPTDPDTFALSQNELETCVISHTTKPSNAVNGVYIFHLDVFLHKIENFISSRASRKIHSSMLQHMLQLQDNKRDIINLSILSILIL